MDSVIMTTPGGGPRLRSRLRSAANAICARSPKSHIHHTYPKISASSHQTFHNHHGKHRTAACGVFANGAVAKALHRSGSFSAGNAKKTDLSEEQSISSTTTEEVPKESTAADVTEPTDNGRLSGRLSREALGAWGARVGPRSCRAPADSLQLLFNDLNLYPSKTQVFEMLVCARQCARRGELSLSFGEFCMFAAQLRRHTQKRTLSSKESAYCNQGAPPTEARNASSTPENGLKPLVKNIVENGTVPEPQHPYEVFLGGSCNPTTWRSDVAIPTLEKMGITYFNPQVADWSLELIEIEHRAKQSARVLFFVLDADTRAAAAAVEAAHLAAAPRPLVLVLQPYRRGQRIGGEVVSNQEYLDLSRGQAILQEVAERRALPVFTELGAALRCTQLLLRGGGPLRPIPSAPTIANHLMKLKKAFDTADESKAGSLSSNQTLVALKAFTGMNLSLHHVETLVKSLATTKRDQEKAGDKRNSSNLCHSKMTNGENRINAVDFELFCSVLAEIMEDSEYTDNTIMIPNKESPDLDDVEQRIRMLMRWEAKVLLDSLTPTEPTKDQSFSFPLGGIPTEQTVSEESDSPQVSGENTNARRPRTTKWRQFLQSVQTAISNIVSKIENSTRSTDSVPNLLNGRPSLTNGTNTTNPCIVANPKSTTTYSRRREQQDGSTRPKHRTPEAEISDDSQSSKESTTVNNTTSGTNGKPARKLSVYIPKVMVGSGADCDSALTPQSSRRLEGLAESVRDEFVAMRDVYLGGSCIVRTTWRGEKVIPILERSNLTYYVPALNDYSRMFSAPPYTPANGGKFTFDGVVNTTHNRFHSQFTSSSRNSPNIKTDISRSNSTVRIDTDISRSNSSVRLETDISRSSSTIRIDTDISRSNSTAKNDTNLSTADVIKISNRLLSPDALNINDGEFPYEARGAYKHERSPTLEGDQPEKKPKYSREGSPASKKLGEEEEVEIRRKGIEGPYPLHSGADNRLSASDFYRIPENASPAPFRGMYDDRQIWGSRVLFFGVTLDTRCLAPMVLAAHCIGLRPKAVVLCVQLLDHPEGLSERAVKDYNRGRLYLIDLAKRENVPVFDSLEEATQCVVQKLRNGDY